MQVKNTRQGKSTFVSLVSGCLFKPLRGMKEQSGASAGNLENVFARKPLSQLATTSWGSRNT